METVHLYVGRSTELNARGGWYGKYMTRIVCRLMPALVDYINVANLCTYLLAEELLTFDERHEILDLKGKHLQVPYLFEILTTKGRDWYKRFWRALKTSVSWNADIHLGHKDLLEMLPSGSQENLAVEEFENEQLDGITLESCSNNTPENEKNQSSKKMSEEPTVDRFDCKCEQLQNALGQARNRFEDVSMENQYLQTENDHLKQEKKYLEDVIEKMEDLSCDCEAKKLFDEKSKINKSTWV